MRDQRRLTLNDKVQNNPLKLPFFFLCLGLGPAVVVIGLTRLGSGGLWVTAFGVLVVFLAAAAIRAIRRGRNPWWIRSPLDR